MPCDRKLKQGQSIGERVKEVRKAVDKFVIGLASGKVKAKVAFNGGITFDGISEVDRNGVADACAYRRVMASGNPLAIAAVQRAEMMAGRTVDKKALGEGLHSHDGGTTWHSDKG